MPAPTAARPRPRPLATCWLTEHDEDVQKQDDMTRMGGGVHAEVRRIKDITIKMKLADLNVVNLTRAVLGMCPAYHGGR